MPVGNSPIRKVLLIDDDTDDFMFFEDALKKIDPTINVSHIASMNHVPAEGNCVEPDLLFLDINMPDRNGFEWLRHIREKGYRFPVIMYSTASNPAFVEKAYKEGANVYFPKPDSINTLEKSLYRLLGLNWSEPDKVTEHFSQNGVYRVFHLAS
jgi:DNA-binding NarL/FixJ family response regulator